MYPWVLCNDFSHSHHKRRLTYRIQKATRTLLFEWERWRPDRLGAGSVKQWIRSAEPPGEHSYENWTIKYKIQDFCLSNLIIMFPRSLKGTNQVHAPPGIHRICPRAVVECITLKTCYKIDSCYLSFVFVFICKSYIYKYLYNQHVYK